MVDVIGALHILIILKYQLITNQDKKHLSQYFILTDFLSMASAAAIISAISDERALSLFRAIAVSENYNTNLLKNLKLTCKQYYAIRKKLIDTGLIEQKNGRYQLTPIGEIVFSAQAKVEIAIENYSKLEALDSIMMSATLDESHLPAKEYQILVDKLIDNDQIKYILCKQTFISVLND